jgi:ParB family chromosome partitioning protein
MSEPVRLIPIAEIDPAALPRDRSGLEPEALRELRESILKSGLRMPVEIFELEGDASPRYGVISGYRRLAVFRELHDVYGLKAYAEIPAFLRAPGDFAAALAAMVEENAVRADLSPWEQGRIAVQARDADVFTSVEEAVDRLYPALSPTKRARIRGVSRVVEVLDGLLTEPEGLSERQLLRLASAMRAGFAEPIEAALQGTRLSDPSSQWAAILPYLLEHERIAAAGDDAADARARAPANRGRPRRVLRLRQQQLIVRREMTRDGYVLRFTGREATSGLIDTVLDQIEFWLSPA